MFLGNPAEVLLLDQEWTDEFCQHLPAEMSPSETAFVQPSAEGSFSLRWFTPSTEVDLCGYATLAAAHVLLYGGVCAYRWHDSILHSQWCSFSVARAGEVRYGFSFAVLQANQHNC